MIFHGLLYVPDEAEVHANLRPGSRRSIDVYVRCAALCAHSVRALGYDYRLVTNRPKFVQSTVQELSLRLPEVVGYEFQWEVPPGIAFHSAHFKLELIEAFGRGIFGSEVALMDLDAVLLSRVPDEASRGLWAFEMTSDITDAYGEQRVRKDLGIAAGRDIKEPRWFGGEYISGDQKAFSVLSAQFPDVWANYKANLHQFHHVGDEMVLAASLLLAEKEGLLVNCASSFVARWWSARTRTQMSPLKAAAGRSVLHLPADKEFLASYSSAEQFEAKRFLGEYIRYARRKIAVRRLLALLQPGKGYSPRL
jgi:hypothetical protein